MKRLAGNKGSVDVKVRHRLRATGLQCPLRTPRNLCHWGSQQGCYHSPQLLQWGSPVNPTVFINVDSTKDSYHLSHWGNQQPMQLQTLERETLTPPLDPSPRERAMAGLLWALGSLPTPTLHLPWTLEPTLLETRNSPCVCTQDSGCIAALHTPTFSHQDHCQCRLTCTQDFRIVSSAHTCTPDPKCTAT